MTKQETINYIKQTLIPHLERIAKDKYPNTPANHKKYGYKLNSKYIKVFALDPKGMPNYVYCFINFQGDIFKPSGWKAPAKGIRGNIGSLDLNTVDSGRWLYKGGSGNA
jgi:hypothetical protein